MNKDDIYQKFYPYVLGGSTKKEMKEKADRHFNALKQININLKRAILLDYDGDDLAINPPANQQTLNEWKRKNIDNYLLVPDAWKRAIANKLNITITQQTNLELEPYNNIVDTHFANENLSLPPNTTWKTVNATIFKVLDGKKLLYENNDSLFQKIKGHNNSNLKINRVSVAEAMLPDEIHEDIVTFFNNLEIIVQ